MTTTSPSKGTWLDIVLTALAPVIWGSTYIVTTQILPPERPFTAALIRVLPSGLLLLIYARRRPARGDWGRLLVLSALNIGAFQALLFVAAYRLPGGLAAVVGAIQPLLVMALAWGVEQRRPLASTVWAAVAGVVGMGVLLLSPGTVFEPIGIVAALAGAASMATGTYLTRRWRLNMPVLALTGWQLLLGGLMLVPVTLMVDPALPSLTGLQIAGYAYLSMAGALLAYALWFRGIARLAPVAVSSLGLLSPLTAVVLGWVLLGQAIRGPAFVGLAMVFASILAVQWTASRT
ncbi:ABC transporter permease [Pandoraea vervacti]|uniref:ABC transporter permease n=1 Tax=Pandoraea vervacti TaxID=656178 RepID=A0ABN4FX37_9BURK|nr:EamA family transporter [Pandoraea vervacti]AJP59889.1 ABC transporter permease [Pandoraea vervacti]